MTANKTIMERQERRVRMGEQKKKRSSWASKKAEDAGKQKVESKRKGGVGTKIMLWNGGGKLTSRIKVNPALKQLLENKPDMFAYGEALIYEASK